MNLPWKYISLSLLIGLLLGGAIGLGSSRAFHHRWMRRGPEMFLKRLDNEVHLSDEQRTRLADLIKKSRARMDSVRDSMREEMRQETRRVLTADQQPAFDQMIAKMDERRKKWERP